MRAVVLPTCAVVALLVVPCVVAAGNAQLHLSLARDVTARHETTLMVRSTKPQPEPKLKVIVVAPRASVMDVVSALTDGGTAGSYVEIPRDGFAVIARRVSATAWKVRLTFPRAGRWRVVVPNWALSGYTTPFPAVARVLVHGH